MVEDKPPAVRAAIYAAPSGMLLLLLATFIAASIWVCGEECGRNAQQLEDHLLECEETCNVQGRGTSKLAVSCKDECAAQVGFTLNKVHRHQLQCKKDCSRWPGSLRFLAFVGVALILTVTPLLGSYRHSCRSGCECCAGKGCSAQLAFFNIAWGFYGFSCLWVLPSVLEDTGEVGGKVLFAVAQGIAMAAMAVSRVLAEKALGIEAPKNGLPHPGGQQQLGVMVGAPVLGPSTQELQQQVKELQQQVRDLVRLQTLQVSAQAAAAPTHAPAATLAPVPAPAAAVGAAATVASQELL